MTLILLVALCLSSALVSSSPYLYFTYEEFETSHDWDYLVFSQKWPVTFCISYTEYGPHRSCNFPKDQLEWTIHGLWPNKRGGPNPFFCNASAAFDVTQLEPIRSQLQDFWPNLEGGKSEDSLWEHEWSKHGTCAMVLPSLSTERRYFQAGLDTYHKYNMTSVMMRLGVLPHDGQMLDIEETGGMIRKMLGVDPYIECVIDLRTGVHYLSEIRVCLDKSFNLIDCLSNNNRFGSSLTNCPSGKSVIYPRDMNVV